MLRTCHSSVIRSCFWEFSQHVPIQYSKNCRDLHRCGIGTWPPALSDYIPCRERSFCTAGCKTHPNTGGVPRGLDAVAHYADNVYFGPYGADNVCVYGFETGEGNGLALRKHKVRHWVELNLCWTEPVMLLSSVHMCALPVSLNSCILFTLWHHYYIHIFPDFFAKNLSRNLVVWMWRYQCSVVRCVECSEKHTYVSMCFFRSI